MSLWSEHCFIVAFWQSQHLSVKKILKNEALEVVPDQTQLRLKTFLIRHKCARRGYYQTQLRSKSPLIRLFRSNWPLIRPSPDHGPDFSDQNYLWSDHLQTIVQTVVRSNFRPDPVISVWEHTGVRSTGSDHKPICVWTSTWVSMLPVENEQQNDLWQYPNRKNTGAYSD